MNDKQPDNLPAAAPAPFDPAALIGQLNSTNKVLNQVATENLNLRMQIVVLQDQGEVQATAIATMAAKLAEYEPPEEDAPPAPARGKRARKTT